MITRKAQKELAKAPQHVLSTMLKARDSFVNHPKTAGPGFDVRPLQGIPGAFRLRIGNWRILYTVDDAVRVVAVTRASTRENAYR